MYLVSSDLQTTCFNNPDIDEAIGEAIRQCGVQVHSGFLLAQWNDGNGGDIVTSASFTSTTKPLRLDCTVSKTTFMFTPLFFNIQRKIISKTCHTRTRAWSDTQLSGDKIPSYRLSYIEVSHVWTLHLPVGYLHVASLTLHKFTSTLSIPGLLRILQERSWLSGFQR